MNNTKDTIKKEDQNNAKELTKKSFSDKIMPIIIYLPAIEYGIIFLLISFLDTSISFSIALAILSFVATLCFEINEWHIYFIWIKEVEKTRSLSPKSINTENNFKPLLIAIITFTVIISLYIILANFIQIQVPPTLPNIFTALTLFGYFLSHATRMIKITKDKYEYSKGNDV